MNLKKMAKYLRVNLLGPGPLLMENSFTGSRSHKVWETLFYVTPILDSESHSLVFSGYRVL